MCGDNSTAEPEKTEIESLFQCDHCDKAFCMGCIRRTVGSDKFEAVAHRCNTGDDFVCFECDASPLEGLVARQVERMVDISAWRRFCEFCLLAIEEDARALSDAAATEFEQLFLQQTAVHEYGYLYCSEKRSSQSEYINTRVRLADGLAYAAAVGMQYPGKDGRMCQYNHGDIQYDISHGYLECFLEPRGSPDTCIACNGAHRAHTCAKARELTAEAPAVQHKQIDDAFCAPVVLRFRLCMYVACVLRVCCTRHPRQRYQ